MPKGKSSSSPRLEQLKRFINEARELERKQPGPPYSSLLDDGISAEVSKELGGSEKTQEQLVSRLKWFEYPYIGGGAPKMGGKINTGVGPNGTSFYNRVEKLGLLDFLLNPPFLWQIRQAWFFRRHHELETELRHSHKSQHGSPVEFHWQVMIEVSSHLAHLSNIEKRQQLPANWLVDYRATLLRQLLREASVCYPQLLLESYEPSSRVRPRSFQLDTVVEMFKTIQSELTKRKIPDNKLGQQLTALICSSDSCMRTGILAPNPETVRTNLRDDARKKQKLLGKSRTKGRIPH